jgi:hypothetical protein
LKNVTLARLGLDGNHISGLGFALPEARLAAGLQSAGLAAKLYSGKPDGQVAELAKQLARTRTAAYLFAVSDQTAMATVQLARELLRLRADLRFFFWAAQPLNETIREALGSTGELISGAPGGAASELLGKVEALSPCAILPSPYLEGLLAAEDVYRIGLAGDQPLPDLVRELAWLEASGTAAETPIPIDATEVESDALRDLCAALASTGPGHRFALRVRAENCPEELVDLLAAARIIRFELVGNAPVVAAQVRGAGIEVVEQQDDGAAARARSDIYARNGYIANQSGLYFDLNPSVAVYHLELPTELAREERQKAYAWASNHMAIRSAALLTGPEALLLEQLGDFAPSVSRETLGWPKHVYAVAKAGDGGGALHVDGHPQPSARIRHIPLAQLSEEDLDADATIFVTLRGAEDVAELEARLDRLHRSGVMRIPNPRFAIHYENSCRWFGLGSCKVAMLRRLQVDAQQRVTTCRDSGEIGRAGDPLDKLAVTVKQRVQVAQVERGCATCAVRDQCSQCVSLPQEWGGRYCEIRRSLPLTALYFEVRAVAHFLRAVLPQDQDHIDLKLSCEGLPPGYYSGPTGPAGQSRGGERPILIGVGERVFAWWRGTTRLLRLSEPLAFMAEGWWLGAEDADVVAALAGRFGVDLETARKSHSEGLNILSAGGAIRV